MTDPTDARVVQALQKLTARLEEAEYRHREPIAIVGIGCRFPEAEAGPAAFWELLRSGKDASKEVTRWDPDTFYDASRDVAGKSYTKRASFLSRIDAFEPAFFQISPREAEAMDPQQRLTLEVAYEAVADAAIPFEQLQTSTTGVFLGIAGSDYGGRFGPGTDAETLQYSSTGNVASVAAGRIAYVFNFTGPCMAIDTACSSSLVAIHSACESLRNRTSDVALAGGVSVLVSSAGFVSLSAVGAISPDGRCKTWDASANGYGRGEGCGMLVLKRLSDALRDGDRIWALLRGSAINSDGHTSGLPAPNPVAQERVIRAALEVPGFAPQAVQYIEAHGTGTVLGDPIEVEALTGVFGPRSGPPLAIGTVKTNFGHLEAGAGVAGVIKTVLAMHHRQLPPSLHFKKPNPHIAWDEVPLRVNTELSPWPSPDAPLVAGVSSFGVSGTNAHVVLEEAPKETAERTAEARALAAKGDALVLLLSAKSPEALEAYAARYADFLEAPRTDDRTYRDLAYTAARSTHSEYRLAVVGKSASEWASRLRAKQVVTAQAAARPSVVFVFSGQALEVELAALYRSWGVEPSAVIGHRTSDVPRERKEELNKLLGTPLREPAQWSAAIKELQNEGHTLFVDLSSDLAATLGEALAPGATVISALRRQEPEREAFLGSLAALHCAGYAIDWSKQLSTRARVASLPSYPWQRARYWVDEQTAPRISIAPQHDRHVESGVRLLIIDNYDSYAYNLYQRFGELTGKEATVVRNDQVSFEFVKELNPTHVVISPGPGNPEDPAYFGICGRVIAELGKTTPLLGVCLGHQGIGAVFGGRIVRARKVMHGKTSLVTHDESTLFRQIESPLTVMRYHSLVIDPPTLPACLRVTARTEDDIIMGVQHTEYPIFGVQFHPESIGTPMGIQILRNFLEYRS